MIVGPPARKDEPLRIEAGRWTDSMDPRPDHQHKVIDMSAFGWIATGHRTLVAPFRNRRHSRKPANRAISLRLETLETIDLMSRAGLFHPPVATPDVRAEVIPFTSTSIINHTIKAMAASQSTSTQTVTVPDTLTNFNQPFTPPIGLFDPTLGTLVSVNVTTSSTLTSQIQSANSSTTSTADITAFTNGNFQINGLITPVSGTLTGTSGLPVTAQIYAGSPAPFQYTNVNVPVTTPGFSVPTNGVIFSPLTVTSNQSFVYTQAADLAFFKATTGRTTITPTLTASASSGASAPNGNLQTQVRTSGSSVVTVTYEYMPVCPPVTKLVRFGIHHQPTQLQLTFGGPLNATDAANTAYYTVLSPNKYGSFTGPGVTKIPVTSAIYDPNKFTVTLTTATRLNVHHLFQLVINLPCTNGNPTVIEFGSKTSLGGFYFHGQHFIRGANGKFVRG